jgi:heme-degrading monooxygenase HmoA
MPNRSLPDSLLLKLLMNTPTITPQPPYYAVIFTSIRTEVHEGYAEMNTLLEKIAAGVDGFIGQDSARNELGISISYWKSPEAIAVWRKQAEHQLAMRYGKEHWYTWYHVRVAKIERDYVFHK